MVVFVTAKCSVGQMSLGQMFLTKIHGASNQRTRGLLANVFAFSIIIGGATEKVLQFIMPLKSIYNQNLGFH
jgi:hypothetical protein